MKPTSSYSVPMKYLLRPPATLDPAANVSAYRISDALPRKCAPGLRARCVISARGSATVQPSSSADTVQEVSSGGPDGNGGPPASTSSQAASGTDHGIPAYFQPPRPPSGIANAAAAAAAVAETAATAANSKNTRVSAQYRPFLDAWDAGYDFNAREEPWGVWLQVTEGALPSDLRGTFFRNGPGRFKRGPDAHRHPHDGDGLVASVAFTGDGRAFYRAAFVRTLEHEAEELAGRVLFRGALGTRRQGGLLAQLGDLTVRNTANAGVALHGGRLLAMSPVGLPYALDPATLATRGPDLLGGRLSPGLPLSLGDPAADAALARLHRLIGANDRLPAAHTALGGDACVARPRVCSTTGRQVFLAVRHLLTGMPVMEDEHSGVPVKEDGQAVGSADNAEGPVQAWAAEPGLAGEEEEGQQQHPVEAAATAAPAGLLTGLGTEAEPGARPPGSSGTSAPVGRISEDGTASGLAWLAAGVAWAMRPPAKQLRSVVTFCELGDAKDEEEVGLREPGDREGGEEGLHVGLSGGALAAAAAPADEWLQHFHQQHRQQGPGRGDRAPGGAAAAGQAAGASSAAAVAATKAADGSRDGGARRRTNKLCYTLPGFGAVNDVAVTPNYYLLLQPPVHPEVLPYLLGDMGPAASLRWREGEPALLHVVPRPGSEAERRGEQPLQLPVQAPLAALHLINAFENESSPGRVVLDGVVYDSLPAMGAQPLPEQIERLADPEAGCRGRLTRLEVDLPGRSVSCSVPAPGPGRHLDLPAFNTAYTGRRHRYVYGCSIVFEDASCGLVKADMDTLQVQRWAPGPGYICLEPCFVPRLPAMSAATAGPAPGPASAATAARTTAAARVGSRGGSGGGGGSSSRAAVGVSRAGAGQANGPQQPPSMVGRQRGEDDGWIVCYGFDSRQRRSELLVFDAWALVAGPVARLALPDPLPHGLYGTWADVCYGPQT